MRKLKVTSGLLQENSFVVMTLNHKKVQQTTTGCTLYPELREKERTQSWCSTWQNRRTERVPYCMECVEEMLQES